MQTRTSLRTRANRIMQRVRRRNTRCSLVHGDFSAVSLCRSAADTCAHYPAASFLNRKAPRHEPVSPGTSTQIGTVSPIDGVSSQSSETWGHSVRCTFAVLQDRSCTDVRRAGRAASVWHRCYMRRVDIHAVIHPICQPSARRSPRVPLLGSTPSSFVVLLVRSAWRKAAAAGAWARPSHNAKSHWR